MVLSHEVLVTTFYLASSYEVVWPVLYLDVVSSRCQCTVNVLIVAKSTRGVDGTEILKEMYALAAIWTPDLWTDSRMIRGNA